MSIQNDENLNNSEEDKSKVKPGASPRTFHSLAEYFASIKELGASEIFVSVTDTPPSRHDPRADVFHAVIEAKIKEPYTTTVRGKKQTHFEAKTRTFCLALDLFVVDQIAQPERFDAMTEEALQPILLLAAAAELDVRRGKL